MGIGLGECAWNDVNKSRMGKCLISFEFFVRVVLFTTAHLEEAWLLITNSAIHGDMFGDDDIRLDLNFHAIKFCLIFTNILFQV